MMKYFFKNKYPLIKIAAVVCCFAIQACNNNKKEKVTYDGQAAAENEITKPGSIHTPLRNRPEDGAFNKLVRPGDNIENTERQKMIVMQIDSTYAAISLLDDTKKELTDNSPEGLTVAERNKKSKAIFNINIIQNELTRALDASILANLKIKTKELAGITAELEKNLSHLQSVTKKLNTATQCIGRLTNILAWGLSKGFVKPLTPRSAVAETVKATVK
jgi:hypothetical protein